MYNTFVALAHTQTLHVLSTCINYVPFYSERVDCRRRWVRPLDQPVLRRSSHCWPRPPGDADGCGEGGGRGDERFEDEGK